MSGDQLIYLLMAVIGLTGAVAGFVLIREIYSQIRFNRLSRASRDQQVMRGSDRKTLLLHRQLVRLLRGDQKTAQRLPGAMVRKHPTQSLDWGYEKVIYDLERDRR